MKQVLRCPIAGFSQQGNRVRSQICRKSNSRFLLSRIASALNTSHSQLTYLMISLRKFFSVQTKLLHFLKQIGPRFVKSVDRKGDCLLRSDFPVPINDFHSTIFTKTEARNVEIDLKFLVFNKIQLQNEIFASEIFFSPFRHVNEGLRLAFIGATNIRRENDILIHFARILLLRSSSLLQSSRERKYCCWGTRNFLFTLRRTQVNFRLISHRKFSQILHKAESFNIHKFMSWKESKRDKMKIRRFLHRGNLFLNIHSRLDVFHAPRLQTFVNNPRVKVLNFNIYTGSRGNYSIIFFIFSCART